MTEQNQVPIEQAPDEVKLAIDLIYLLESQQIPSDLALKAVQLVKNDLENKLANQTP